MDYQRPPQMVDLAKDTDGVIKREMIKTFALASVIYEEDLSEKAKIPFVHHGVDDIAMLRKEESELQKEISLVSVFEEFNNLLEEPLGEDDIVSEQVLQKQMSESKEDSEELMEFIKSEKGGGGMAKCYPLSYL